MARRLRLKWPRGVLCVDVETDGLHPEYGHRPFLVGAQDELGRSLLIDVRDGVMTRELRQIKRAVESRHVVKLAHNAKFEIRMFRAMGWKPRGQWLDPMNMVVFLDEYSRLSLKELARIHFGERYEEQDRIKAWLAAENRRRRKPWLDALRERLKRKYGVQRVSDIPEYQRLVKEGKGAPPEATYRDFYEANPRNARNMLDYLQKDLDYTIKLMWLFLDHVREHWSENFDWETRLVERVADMEDAGLPIGREVCESMQRRYRRLQRKHLRRFYEIAGEEINLNSPAQLLKTLRAQGIKIANTRKQTLGGLVSGGAEGGLRDRFEIVRELLEYRACTKVLQYFDKFLEVGVGDDVLRVHASFWQNGQDQGIKTGRFSITDPGLQTIPGGYRGTVGERGKDVRRVIVPSGPGRVLLMIDYAQVEPRVLSHYTQEPSLIASLQSGEDIYLAFVRIFFGERIFEGWTADSGLPMPKMLKQRRSDSKTIILAIMYGMGVDLMAAQLGTKTRVARGMRAKCFRRMPSMRDLMRDCSRDVVRQGYVEDLFGRHYRVPTERAYKGINAIIQGAAAHIMKRALVACGDALERWNRGRPLAERARMLLTVHDEIVFDVPREHMDELAALLKATMEAVAPELSVPLQADVSWSDRSWGDKVDWVPPRRRRIRRRRDETERGTQGTGRAPAGRRRSVRFRGGSATVQAG